MDRLLLLGLNHATAPLAVREKLAFTGDQRQAALSAFRDRFPGAEAALLSTCNRVELYSAAAEPSAEGADARVERITQFLAELRGVRPEEFRDHLYRKADRDVVNHLFTVASSLDSMVIGETQILGQVREAYDEARALAATGALLNPLFQRAIAVGKPVMTETPLGEGRLSVASVAVEYARRIFDHFNDKTVLNIGAGKMAGLVLKHFADLKPRRLLVCNRDAGKAGDLAGKFGGEPVPLDRLDEWLTAADVVITSTGAPHAIITREQFESLRKHRRYRPIFIIDIALPRDVEEGVGEIQDVYLYNIDDLQQVVSATLSQRRGAVEAARAIVDRQVKDFLAWHRAREMGPLIDQLFKRYHQVAQEEVNRTLNKLPNVTDAERQHLEELARRIVNKLLHGPVQRLRNTDNVHSPGTGYLHALEKLFQLDAGSELSSDEQRDE